MADNAIKKIKTSCPFPMLLYKASVRYNEVRKASGIAYILLELIQKSVMGKEKIATVLKGFGIPSDMLYIFAKELSSLVANGIVESKYNASYIDRMQYFEEMTLDTFSLTEKGVKMFKEGAIPTGQEKAKSTDVYYSPVTRKFVLNTTQSYAPIETSFLGSDFMESVEYDVSGMEDYLKTVKSKIGLKAEELIVSTEYGEPKELAAKVDENLTIVVDAEGVSFQFSSSDETAFFERYYSSELMTSGMLAKEKYKFAKPVATVDWEGIAASNLHIPADAPKQVSRPCKIFLNRGNHGYSRNDNVLTFDGCESLLDILDENAEFALLDLRECKYYSPVNIRFPNKNFGDVFEMQLLIEEVADNQTFTKLLQEILSITYDADYTVECGKIVAYVATVMKEAEYLNGYASKKLCEVNSDEERIEILLNFNSLFQSVDGWNTIFTTLAEELFVRYVETVELDNAIFKNTVLTPLVKAMNMDDSKYIARFAAHMKETEAKELVYQALESAEFDEAAILSVVNVVGLYMEKVLDGVSIDGTTAIANKFAVLESNLWKLCEMLGIEDISDYTIRDDYNVDEFFNAYATFKQKLDALEEYRSYAKDAFAEIKLYTDVIETIHNLHSVERTASEHPENITKKFINEQTARGKYSVVISNLLIKAQYDLRALLSADTSLGALELIDEAQEQGIIDKHEADLLHRLRMCRNALQHPEKKQIPYDNKTIEEWRDIVFSLKGEKA